MARSQAGFPQLYVDNQLQGANNPAVEDDMSDGPTRDEIDAKIGRASAETETKIARLEGKLDLVLTKLDDVSTRLRDVRDDNRSIKSNAWIIAFGIAAIILAVGFGVPAVFSNGLQTRDVVHSEIRDLLAKPGTVH